MRIGPERVIPEVNRDSYLDELCSNTSEGIVRLNWQGDLPHECVSYVMSSWPYWGLHLDDKLETVARTCAWYVYMFLDMWQPYTWFSGISDVDVTHEWANHTYETANIDGSMEAIIDNENIESFRLIPGQADTFYQDQLRAGGEFLSELRRGDEISLSRVLERLLGHTGCDLEMFLNGEMGSDPVALAVGEHCLETDRYFKSLCGCNTDKMYEYLYTGAWAAFLWFVGPEGREWRNTNHDIFEQCSQYGFSIIYNGSLLDSSKVRMTSAAPLSCASCQIDSWCTSLVSSGEGVISLCEHCLSGGIISIPGGSCGTKICRYLECHHNLYHNNLGGLGAHMNKFGFLAHKDQNEPQGLAYEQKKVIGYK